MFECVCVELQMVNVCWWFYFSKFIELSDTVSNLVLDKPGNLYYHK